MKKNKILIPLFIIIATILMGIGYAAVNSVSLDIIGEANAEIQSGIYITDARYIENNNAIVSESDIINVQQNMFASNIVLSSTDANSSITYEIKIYNSTNEPYYFQKVDYLDDSTTYSNNGIEFFLTGLTQDTILNSKQELTFTITFKYKDNIIAENNTLTSYLNFKFNKKYTMTYVGFTNNNYQTTIYEGETLTVEFNNESIYGVKIYKNDTIFQDYEYQNKILTIENVTSDLTINAMTDLGYDIVITDTKNSFNTIDLSTTGDISVSEYKNRELNGMNITDKYITNIDIILNYSAFTGSRQSVEITLVLEDGTTWNKLINFNKKVNQETIVVTFENLSIAPGSKFYLNNNISKITNEQIVIHDEEIEFYTN